MSVSPLISEAVFHALYQILSGAEDVQNDNLLAFGFVKHQELFSITSDGKHPDVVPIGRADQREFTDQGKGGPSRKHNSVGRFGIIFGNVAINVGQVGFLHQRMNTNRFTHVVI